jgi:predicted permease
VPDEVDLHAFIDRIVAASGIDNAADRESLRRELLTHFEDAGTTPDALRAALRRFGGERAIADALRQAHQPVPPLEAVRRSWFRPAEVLQDVRFGTRMLVRTPGFSIVAVFCLAIGIGATTAVMSWIEGISLRPYPLVAHQERLVAITGTTRADSGRDDVSWPDFLDLQRGSTLFDAFIAEKITGATFNIGDRAQRLSGSVVSANYFDALGVRPILGRGFRPGDDVGRNAHPDVVIGYRTWKERLNGDPNVIGTTLMLNGLPHTIVGVTPEDFHGTFVGYSFQFWVPASMQPQHIDAGRYELEDRGARWIEGFARLKSGVTIQQAQEEVSAIAARLEGEYPATNRGRGIRLYPLWQTPFNGAGSFLPTLEVALAVVMAVLLIACANVSTLLLVRALARQPEMTLRLAIGAGRWRLVRQLLVEGFLLSIAATAAGFVLAYWGRDLLAALVPPRGGVPLRLPAEFDWRVLALSGGIGVLTTLLFALVPALLASRVDLAGALRAQSASVVSARGRLWVRSGLVLLQVSLSFVLLVGAGLLVRSLTHVSDANPGFSTGSVVMSTLDLFSAGYDAPRAKNLHDELMGRVQSIGGVESVALSRMVPFSYRTFSSGPIAVDGYQPPPDQQPNASYNEVTPGYFKTLGIPLVAGRDFTRADDETSEPVAIVDETMAAQYWGGADPIDKRLQLKGRWMRVVGIAKNAKYRNLLETPQPFFYVPLRQNFTSQAVLLIRTTESPASIAPTLAREVHALDGSLAPGEIITMREQVRRTTAAQRIAVTMLSMFGAVALALAAIGLYGVMSSTVSQSRRELAVRMALGAGESDVLRLVLSRGLVLTASGMAIGAVVALGVTRLMGYLLYQVSPRDPLTFGSAFVVTAVCGIGASFLPAWRATRIDPLRSLRT